jgi:hypothetical protein
MNEQEAKTKWCPMVRFQIGNNDNVWQGIALTNRGKEMRSPEFVMCIASNCMMWRWNINTADANGVKYEEGYCGLGGNHERI